MEWYSRELTEADAVWILDAFRGEDMARQGTVVDMATAAEYIAAVTRPATRHRVAAERETDRVLAFVGASIDVGNRSAWIYYWSIPSVRGAHITSTLVRDFSSDLLRGGLDRLELGFRTNNPASRRVAERAGFVVEGLEREKFLIDGTRVDVVTCGRLPSDPWPAESALR